MRAGLLMAIFGLTGFMLMGCPDPQKVGHAPKKQIEKAEKAVEKIELRMNQQVRKANKALEAAGAAAQAADEVGE